LRSARRPAPIRRPTWCSTTIYPSTVRKLTVPAGIFETYNISGGGTAWHLAEKGHQVTIVTPDPFVGREIVRTAADLPLRMRLAKLGARFITESAVTAWYGDGATIRNLLDGSEQRLPFDTLVLATINRADTEIAEELQADGVAFSAIGDCLARRHAPAPTFEGRRLGLEI